MGRATRFSQVLDEKLRACSAEEPRPAFSAGFRPAPVYGFFVLDGAPRLDDRGDIAPKAAAAVPRRAEAGSAWARGPHVEAPRRALSLTEERALDALRALGARIGGDFTREELRTAFRTLAREYHPDRHPGGTAGEKARLSVAFSRLHDAYLHLKGAARES